MSLEQSIRAIVREELAALLATPADLTLDEVAAELQVSYRHVKRLTMRPDARTRLRSFNVGAGDRSMPRVTRAELDRWKREVGR